MGITLHFRGGPLAGKQCTFEDDVETIVIGRDPDQCQVQLPAEMTEVGRQHLALRREIGRYRLVINRDNPVYVDGKAAIDGQELPATAEIRLGKDGQQIVAKTDLGGAAPETVRREGAGPGLGTRLQRSERSAKRNLKVIGIVGAVVVALGVVWFVLFKETKERLDVIDKITRETEDKVQSELKAYEEELASLKGTLGEDRKELAILVVERGKRAALLEELRSRQDLDEKERQKLEKKLEKKLDDTDRKLGDLNKTIAERSGQKEDWAALAEKYEPGLFVIIAENLQRNSAGKARTDFDGNPRFASRAIGTAFCIRKDGLLATNAHVVKFLETTWDSTRAYQSGTGRGFHIEKFARHPKWDPETIGGPDVGLIQLKNPQPGSTSANALPVLALATEEQLKKLKIGTELGTLGFPGEFLEEYVAAGAPGTATRAHATFKSGFVGRMMDYEGTRHGFATDHHIQHSAQTTGGCSGSPLFMLSGEVVACHHAAQIIWYAQPVVDAAGKVTGFSKKNVASPAALQFGVRVDELQDFWKDMGW